MSCVNVQFSNRPWLLDDGFRKTYLIEFVNCPHFYSCFEQLLPAFHTLLKSPYRCLSSNLTTSSSFTLRQFFLLPSLFVHLFLLPLGLTNSRGFSPRIYFDIFHVFLLTPSPSSDSKIYYPDLCLVPSHSLSL